MLVSKIAPGAMWSLGAVRNVVKGNLGIFQRRLISTSKPRQGGHEYYYRTMPPPDNKYERLATGMGAFMWWWIFWHCMTDYHHLIGHETFISPDTWTDAELGIPPDDDDDPE